MSTATKSAATRPRLTKEQAKQVRSLVADEGWTRAEAIALVIAGWS